MAKDPYFVNKKERISSRDAPWDAPGSKKISAEDSKGNLLMTLSFGYIFTHANPVYPPCGTSARERDLKRIPD
jgi:hypothetical protein